MLQLVPTVQVSRGCCPIVKVWYACCFFELCQLQPFLLGSNLTYVGDMYYIRPVPIFLGAYLRRSTDARLDSILPSYNAISTQKFYDEFKEKS